MNSRDQDALAAAVAEQLVLMAGTGAAPLDLEALAGAHEGGRALFLEAAEEGGHRHVERARQGLERAQRRRYAAVLDLREHAGRKARRLGQLHHGHVELLAKGADLAADGDLEMVLPGAAEGVRVLLGGTIRTL
jgi:hypothetical protein